jgi:hypothetical protein
LQDGRKPQRDVGCARTTTFGLCMLRWWHGYGRATALPPACAPAIVYHPRRDEDPAQITAAAACAPAIVHHRQGMVNPVERALVIA